MDIAGKVAVVTGAGSGIGAALAQALIGKGASVVLSDLNPDTVTATAEAIKETLDGADKDRVVAVAGDAGSTEDIQRFLDTAEEQFGRPVDLYAANAGIGGGVGLESSDERWELTLNVNVMAHVRAARLLVPGWLERGSGYFLSTASSAGLLTQIGSAPYAVTKHAAVAFAEWLTITYGSRGIEVGCLCPLGVNTNLLKSNPGDSFSSQAIQAVRSSGTILEPEDVAEFTLRAVENGDFLIMPHEELPTYLERRNTDYDRWIGGMRRLQDKLTS